MYSIGKFVRNPKVKSVGKNERENQTPPVDRVTGEEKNKSLFPYHWLKVCMEAYFGDFRSIHQAVPKTPQHLYGFFMLKNSHF